MTHFDPLPFCLIFALIIAIISLFLQHWAHYIMHDILSRLSGISALKTVIRNIENSLRNLWKPIEKHEFTHYIFSQYLGTYTMFLKTHAIVWYFHWKKNLIKENLCWILFFPIYLYFSVSFQYFLKQISALKLPLNATEKCAQRWKYKANEDYWSKNMTKQKKVKVCNFL